MRIFKKSLLLAVSLFAVLLPGSALCAGEKIAVLPWRVNAPGDVEYIKAAMPDMLATRLSSGGSEIIRPAAAAPEKKAGLDDAAAFEAGKAMKADYVLYGSLTIFGNAVSMDARLININTGEAAPFASKGMGIESIISLVDKLSSDVNSRLNPALAAPPLAPPAVAAPAIAPKAVPAPAASTQAEGFIVKADKSKEEPVVWRGREIKGMFVAMTAADLDRDGRRELFLISDHEIVVARYGAEGMEVIKEIRDTRRQNVAITSIDSDRDGAVEVYVSRVSDGRPESALLEFVGGAFSLAPYRIDWMLRAVSVDGGEPVLVGQRLRAIDGFYGDLKRLKKEGDGVREAGDFEMALPKGVNLYGFEAFRLTGGDSSELATLDPRQYLTVYSQKEGKGWAQSYKSSEYYGGTLNHMRLKDIGASESALIPIEGAYFSADLDRDGRRELIIRKNTPGGLGRSADIPTSFKSGEILSLSWDPKGATTSENWRTKPVEGYISDFFIDDLDGDGNAEVTMLVVTGTEKLFGTLKSYILSHRISL